MKKNSKLHLQVGDTVKIIAGSYKTKTGKIIKVNKKTGKVIIKGINLKFKHIKPNNENDIGEIKQFEAPIHHSNVKLNN